jgi:nucleoside triphosphatase
MREVASSNLAGSTRMREVKRKIVSAVIVSKDEKILFGKQRKGGVYPDCWHIPGGGVEAGETLEQALCRETQEETGIDVTKYPKELLENNATAKAEKTDKISGEKYIADMQFNTYLIIFDKNADEIEVILNDDLEEYVWIQKKELKNYKLTPPSVKLFYKLGWI